MKEREKFGSRLGFILVSAGCAGDWKMDAFVENSIKAIREKVGDGKVLCALSGGVDSSVAAVMLSKAIGNQLTCVFVDHLLHFYEEVHDLQIHRSADYRLLLTT